MTTDIVNILQDMYLKKINYFVLRDFETKDRINNSTDVDIFVNKKDLKRTINLLNEYGFVVQRLTPCKYPHIQLKKISDKIYRIDIVTDFFYGINKFKLNLNDMNIDIKSTVNDFGILVPNEQLAIYLMICHILFDKQEFSQKNYKIIQNMYIKYSINNYKGIENIDELLKEISKLNLEECNVNVNKFQDIILSSRILKKVKIKYILNIKMLLKRYINGIVQRLKNKSIAIIGVDGSGKSSTVEMLNQILENDSVVVYMGLKNFKFKYCEDYEKKEIKNYYNKIKYNFLLYIDFISRYFKYRFSPNIIIFDRYVDDIIVNTKGNRKILDILFYKILFPKVKIKFYLYCDIDTSIHRKNDIDNFELFKEYKCKYDLYATSNTKIISVNTDEKNEKEVIDLVTKEINKKVNREI